MTECRETMPEKLFNLKDASVYLGIPEEEIAKLVEKGEIPAYKIGGAFLRFRKEQLEAIADEVRSEATPTRPERAGRPVKEENSDATFFDRIADFIYFSDFYIISILLLSGMLYIIFK